MPVYHVTDPQTGISIDLRGSSPPTEQELIDIFENLRKQRSANSDVNRRDTNILGINHDAIQHTIADYGSRLPEPIRQYGTQQAAFGGDMLASLLEAMSAPESIAGSVAGAFSHGMPPSNAPPIPIPPEPTGGMSAGTKAAFGEWLQEHPSLKIGPVRVAPFASKGRQMVESVDPYGLGTKPPDAMLMEGFQQIGAPEQTRHFGPPPYQSNPSATAADMAAAKAAMRRPKPPTPKPAAEATTPPAAAATGQGIIDVASELKPSQPEAVKILQWTKEGIAPDVIRQRIELARQLKSSPSFSGLPSDADVWNIVEHKNARTVKFHGQPES